MPSLTAPVQTEPQRSPRSTFRSALLSTPVPATLQEGVNVLRVDANGKTKPAFITLSEDKFTLYITSSKYKKSNGRSFFRRRTADAEERAVDVGSIDRIQRGNVAHKFDLIKKSQRQDSQRSLNSNLSKSGKDDDDTIVLRPDRCFSIIFRGEWTLDLMTADDVKTEDLLDALDLVIRTYQEQKVRVSNDVLLLRYVWLEADKDKTNTITASELGHLLNRINFQIKKSQLNDMYEKFGKTIGLDRRMRRQGLEFEQCCTLLHKIKRDTWMVKPINVLWNHLFGEFMKNGKARTTVSDKTFLEKFMHRRQGETKATLADVRQLFARLNDLEMPHVADGDPKDPTRIDKNRFEAYLLSDENDAFDPSRSRLDRRLMNKPISEYWINSSHNTYLTGDQFTSHSKVEMYLSALYRGCRCLELDVWDGEIEDGVPVPAVWHGRTMTSKIRFQDIIRVVKVFLNFHPDTFPIILSFENHCSLPYQEVMASDVVRILGERLYIPSEASLMGRLPSPWALRGMVVIKGRRPIDFDAEGEETDDDSDEEGVPLSVANSEETKPPSSRRRIRHKVSPQLARLTLFHGVKLMTLDDSVMNPTHHMHSFSESRVKSMCKKGLGRKWVVYNQSHMTRTYPSGSRVHSSNYIPVLPWSVGCQMVALNVQTHDAALFLNDGRFRENGSCGYVLKPSALMEMQEKIDKPIPPLKLSIRVLSGSCLPKPMDKRISDIIDPYVRVTVYDVKNGDKEMVTTFFTNVVKNNGFFPIWNSEKFVFSVFNWSVAMLQLTVYDNDVGSKDEFVATASIPFSCLRKGMRSVRLFDSANTRSGTFDFASLLIDVKSEKTMAEI